jgi:hypothetical protein
MFPPKWGMSSGNGNPDGISIPFVSHRTIHPDRLNITATNGEEFVNGIVIGQFQAGSLGKI